MSNFERIKYKFELVNSEIYKNLKEEFTSFIISKSSNPQFDPLLLKGMLMLIDEADRWKIAYEEEIAKRRKQNTQNRS